MCNKSSSSVINMNLAFLELLKAICITGLIPAEDLIPISYPSFRVDFY